TFSSTIIITKLLSDKGDIRSVYGRYTVGLMLVQDVVAVVIMILLPALRFGDAFAVSLVLLILKSLFFLAGVYVVTRMLLPIVLNKVAESEEFLLIFALAWCFTISGLAEWLGLSLEVGAIVAGLSLAASPYQLEIGSRVRPLRDFFIVLFFVILGSEMSLGHIQEVFWPGLAISAFILVGNPLILYTVFRLMRFTRKNSFLSGLTAAQVSEFGFVFLFVSQGMGLVGNQEISLFTLAALITIFLSSYLIPYNRQIFSRIEPWFVKLAGRDRMVSVKEKDDSGYEVLVFGYHRLGWKICDSLQKTGHSFAVVDFDPVAIEKLKKRDIPYYFGDASDVDFLTEVFSQKTKMVISTLPEFDDQVILVRQLRNINQKAVFIGNLSHVKFLNILYEEGADFVIIPHLLAGSWMAELIETKKCNRHTFRSLRSKQKQEMRLRCTLGH
ncbi:MAG TPA: cation:proton antiporter, partial [Patescibacteria group bacterium]|nr:cation:proton antiporter [Patescibacteria group bacterium]